MTPEERARMMMELEAIDPGPPADSSLATPEAYVQQPGQAQWQVSRDAGIAQRKRGLEEAAMDREIQQSREAAAREQMNRNMAHAGFMAPGSEHLKPGEYGGPPAKEDGGTFEDRMGRLSGMLGGFSQQSAPRQTRYVSSPGEVKKNIRPADNSLVYEALSNSDYEYKDPAAPGAGDGTYNGPMAEELKAIPGVVAPGPDGYDRVDTGRLTMANASETGKLRRELTELQQRLAALDSPDDVLSEVNKPAPSKAPRRGTTANVDMGEIAYETDPSYDGDWSSLESAGRNEQAIMRAEMEGRRNQGIRNELDQYREWGVAEQPVSAGDNLQFKSGVSPYDTEFNRDPTSFGSTILSPQSDAEQAARLRQQYAMVTGERPADDFDSRHRQDVIAQGNSRGVDGTGPERAAAVDEYIAGLGISGPVSRESAAQLARQMNTEHATGRLISNIQPGEILEALRRRTEMAL